jgi:hypothetical protein
MKEKLNHEHVSGLSYPEVAKEAMKVLNLWFGREYPAIVFTIENESSIYASNITKKNRDVARALCFGVFFGIKGIS